MKELFFPVAVTATVVCTWPRGLQLPQGPADGAVGGWERSQGHQDGHGGGVQGRHSHTAVYTDDPGELFYAHFYHWRELPQVSKIGLLPQIFVSANIILSWQKRCHDKRTFVETKHVFCHNKGMLVATTLLLWQNYVCCDKSFVMTSILFVATKDLFCCDKNDTCGSFRQVYSFGWLSLFLAWCFHRVREEGGGGGWLYNLVKSLALQSILPKFIIQIQMLSIVIQTKCRKSNTPHLVLQLQALLAKTMVCSI